MISQVPNIPIAPPPKEEPPEPKKPEPEEDIRKIGKKIGEFADEVADKVESFQELIDEHRKDLDAAVATVREIGKALESTGRDARGGAYDVPEVIEDVPPVAPEATYEPETTTESEPREESNDGLPWWAPWVLAGGLGLWGLGRNPA